MAGKKSKRPADSSAILELALELLAVGLFTILAGTNDDIATLVILFMVGLWLIWLIQNSSVVSGLENMLGSVG